MVLLKVHKTPDVAEIVRITPEAGAKLQQIQRETGLSARYIVSQIILQCADEIQVEEVEL